jgi:integral membrane protein
MNTPVGRLRAVGFVEGLSFLVLLGIAMPLRRFAGLPEAVTWTGWVHGILFMLYCAAAVWAYRVGRLPRRLAGWSLVAAVVPAGPFVLDPHLRRHEAMTREGADAGAT